MHWPYTLLVTSDTPDTLDIPKTATPPVSPSASPSPVNILHIQADYGYQASINLDTRSLIWFDTRGLTSPEYSQYPYNDNYSASALLAGSSDTLSSSSPLSAGGIAGVVVGSLAVVALGVVAVVAGVRRRRRQQQGQQGNDVELESTPVDQTPAATTVTAPAEIASARPGEAESRA
ncbi:hypothetical protein EMPS_02723 [Entomortierella parvispora]|uniref:Uncharacterized protein n=1 Tax=Entomortierella parvispora TaxID=205924 RepID=A0A9P3LTY5_9FUNG|nr:hypothetical protein EMPS_02723 [Entomortierella parvispora]